MIAWPTAALLAAIVVLEGARRVRAGDIALRRPLFGPWSVTPLDTERRRWMLVSWAPPLWTSIVLPPQRDPQANQALPERLRAVRPWFLALSALGLLVLVALVGGIPFAERRSTGMGVLLAIGVVMLLAACTTAVAAWARGRLNLPRGPAWAALSPFAAPAAAERLLQDALTPYPTLAVAKALLPADAFRKWMRPRAYDAQSHPDPELRDAVTRDELAAMLAPPAATGDAALYCPRCGAVYRDGTDCSDCAAVTLQRFPANLPPPGSAA